MPEVELKGGVMELVGADAPPVAYVCALFPEEQVHNEMLRSMASPDSRSRFTRNLRNAVGTHSLPDRVNRN